MKITDIIKRKFTISAELFPVKNYEENHLIGTIIPRIKRAGIDFVSITKGKRNNSRAGSIAMAGLLKNNGVEVLSHVTCAGYSKEDIENFIVELSYFRVENILAIRGDDSDCGDSIGLIEQIDSIKKGKYYGGTGESKNLCIGVASHIEAEDYDDEGDYLKRKVESGAEFSVTQLFFDAEQYEKYVGAMRKKGITIPIIPGVMPVLNDKVAGFVENVIGIKVPERFRDYESYKALIKDLKSIGAPGVHLFILNNVDTLDKILQQ